jgi:hypothetical protein
MAIQKFTTGGNGILTMAPVIFENGVPKLADEASSFPTSLDALYDNEGKIDPSVLLELAIFTSKDDEVGIVSTASSLDATPKTIAFTIDREDKWALRFLQRYCKSLRCGLETPATQSKGKTAK